MALRSRARRSARPASARRSTSSRSRRVGGGVRRTRSRRAAAPRTTTVRVVVQSAPAPVVTQGAVSMETMKKARF